MQHSSKLAPITALLIVCLASFLLCFPALGESQTPTNRALLIASDFFLSQQDSWPSSANNVTAISTALKDSGMDFDLMRTYNSTLSTLDGLYQAVWEAFGEARDGDVSYFYVSTHGVYDPKSSNMEAALLLSDGETEVAVTARQLEDAFRQIRGTKVLIIDACQSGALIGKGVSGGAAEAAFLGPDFVVLTSSGGSEESWYWNTDPRLPGLAQGAGYFSSVLAAGISAPGGFAADSNRDGQISAKELYQYLLENHGASTTQIYPQDSDCILLTYNQDAFTTANGATGDLTGITFDDTLLDSLNPSVDFSFTVLKPTQVAYQLVYYQDNRWQFDTARLMYDDQELGGDYGDQKGYLAPGRKVRSISLNEVSDSAYGYVMIQLITLTDGAPTIHASRVLCVPPKEGDPELEIKTGPEFLPAINRELPILINHQYPCALTVSIETLDGQVINRLSYRQTTRPQQLRPAGSVFYWNGCDKYGNTAQPGSYRVRVTAYLHEDVYEILSEPFMIMETTG